MTKSVKRKIVDSGAGPGGGTIEYLEPCRVLNMIVCVLTRLKEFVLAMVWLHQHGSCRQRECSEFLDRA